MKMLVALDICLECASVLNTSRLHFAILGRVIRNLSLAKTKRNMKFLGKSPRRLVNVVTTQLQVENLHITWQLEHRACTVFVSIQLCCRGRVEWDINNYKTHWGHLVFNFQNREFFAQFNARFVIGRTN